MSQQHFHIQPLLYFRFLDDTSTRSQLTEYQTFLNSVIAGVRVTFTVHHHIIEFLDTYVQKHIDVSGICTLQTKTLF